MFDLIGGRGRNRTYNLSVKRTLTNVISTTYAERLAAKSTEKKRLGTVRNSYCGADVGTKS